MLPSKSCGPVFPGYVLKRGGRDEIHLMAIFTPLGLGEKSPTEYPRTNFNNLQDKSGWRDKSQYIVFVDTRLAIEGGIVFRKSATGAILRDQEIDVKYLMNSRSCSGKVSAFGRAIFDVKGPKWTYPLPVALDDAEVAFQWLKHGPAPGLT